METLSGVLQSCGAELVLLLAVAVITVLESAWPRRGARFKGLLAIAAVAVAFLALPASGGPVPAVIARMWTGDAFAVIFKSVILLAAVFALFLAVEDAGRRFAAAGEYAILVLLAAVGMMVMVSATDLVVVVLGVELMAVSFYILAGFAWFREASTEAAVKYVVTGLFASALLLYGVSLVYGAAGGTGFDALARVLRGAETDYLAVAGIAFVACGLAFKMGAAPFQMWMPDVLEGAPTPVAGYLAVGPKVAVLGVAVRLFAGAFPTFEGLWVPLWWSLAAVTILWGNLGALVQPSVKRMLAYSSVSHVGYLLLALVASGTEAAPATASLVFYLTAYVFMNLGAFGVVVWLEHATGGEPTWRSLAGLGRSSPGVALLFALFLFSLAGIPPTAGFLAKFWVFLAGWRAGYPGLVLVAALGSLIGAGYYLRVIYAMYLLPAGDDPPPARPALPLLLYALVLAALGTAVAGVFPQFFMALALRASGG